MRGEFRIPKNPGPIPDQAWANDVKFKIKLLPRATLHDPWRLDLEVDFELEVADPNYLPLITLSRHHNAYEIVMEDYEDESGAASERESPTKIRIGVHYQGDVSFDDHAIRIALSLFQDKAIENGFTREEFGDLEFILVPQGLGLKMEAKAFSLQPDNFVRAIKQGIEQSMLDDDMFDTIPTESQSEDSGIA